MWADFYLDFSLTTLHRKYSCRTITPRSMYGRWVLSCTSCCPEKFPSLAIQNWRSSATSSRVTSISITSLSLSTHQKPRSSCNASLWRMWTSVSQQNKPSATPGSKTMTNTKATTWTKRPFQKCRRLWVWQGCRKWCCCTWARTRSRTT